MINVVYDGDGLWIEEMPQGCVIASKSVAQGHVVVASPDDALAIIESLKKMLVTTFNYTNEQ